MYTRLITVSVRKDKIAADFTGPRRRRDPTLYCGSWSARLVPGCTGCSGW